MVLRMVCFGDPPMVSTIDNFIGLAGNRLQDLWDPEIILSFLYAFLSFYETLKSSISHVLIFTNRLPKQLLKFQRQLKESMLFRIGENRVLIIKVIDTCIIDIDLMLLHAFQNSWRSWNTVVLIWNHIFRKFQVEYNKFNKTTYLTLRTFSSCPIPRDFCALAIPSGSVQTKTSN